MRKSLLLFAVFGLASLVWAADDPFIGTWKLNVAESKLPFSLPKSQVTKIEIQSDGFIKSTNDIVEPDGAIRHTEWVGKRDGKDYPLKGGPTGYTISVTLTDTNSTEQISRINGQEVARFQVIVSDDGKTMTAKGKWKDAEGKEITGVTVSDKQ